MPRCARIPYAETGEPFSVPVGPASIFTALTRRPGGRGVPRPYIQNPTAYFWGQRTHPARLCRGSGMPRPTNSIRRNRGTFFCPSRSSVNFYRSDTATGRARRASPLHSKSNCLPPLVRPAPLRGGQGLHPFGLFYTRWAPWNSICRGRMSQWAVVIFGSFSVSFSSRPGSWVMHSRVGPAPDRQNAAPVVRMRA